MMDRYGCSSGCPSGHPNGRLSGVRCQGFGLIDTREECLGRGTEAGICLEVDKHAGEP